MITDFSETRPLFHLPEGITYLDGNSLGPLPAAAGARVADTIGREWGDMLITAWNRAGWMDKPMSVGNRIARLIGAEPDSVAMGDTLSIKVYQALASALEMNPGRKVILSDSGNFPSDLYMAQGLCRTLGQGYELRVVEPEAVLDAIDDTIAVTMITEVDYRTGRKHDMAAITARAHQMGALTIWDLAHSAGAFPVELAKCGADFACGCTYKY
ncbi:MAG: aminotransferase class V-fold PLP-dependent enzyme, partial [Rhodobacteraceae bacterium]|nr:aminotransferase class V-fold PLP-dependent enzyme [Paracoccaceae bacterium]